MVQFGTFIKLFGLNLDGEAQNAYQTYLFNFSGGVCLVFYSPSLGRRKFTGLPVYAHL